MENVQTIPPPYVVRTVLIYSHHVGQLQFNPSEAFSVSMKEKHKQDLITKPYFLSFHKDKRAGM